MREEYGLKGAVQKLEQRKAWTLDRPKLAAFRNRDSFDVEFSPSGNVLQIRSYNNAGDFMGSDRFSYDGSGRIIHSIESDAAGVDTSHSDYAYPEKGRVITTRKRNGESV